MPIPRGQALRDMIARADAAMTIIDDLNQGRRRWMMSIPARPLYDPDLLLAASICEMRDALRCAADYKEPEIHHLSRAQEGKT